MKLPFTIASRAIQGNFDFLAGLLSTPSAWADLTPLLLNSWTAYDAPMYSKDALGYVQLRGEVRSWTGGSTAADVAILGAFPAGFRPVIRAGCPVWANDAVQLSLYVTTANILVSRAVGASVVVNLNGVRFPTR